MRICVVSDVHYKYSAEIEPNQHHSEIFLAFLRDIVGKYDLLVLNGDIFDLWYDWRYTIIKQYFPMLRLFADIRDAGCRIVMINGNHDFWHNGFLRDFIGVEVMDQEFTLQSDGKRMFFAHGDRHTVNDLRYRFLRLFLRWNLTKRLFSFLHPGLALSLGKCLSRSSRKMNGGQSASSKKSAGLRSHAAYLIQKGMFDVVCMGHSHEPLSEQIGAGVYLNSGDWIRHHTYIEITNGEPVLKQYLETGDKT